MWAGCSSWIRRPYMCQSVCDQDTKSQAALRGREAPWYQLLTRHTVYVHLFCLIFKNIFWHVSTGCSLTMLWMLVAGLGVPSPRTPVCVLCGSPSTKLIWIGILRETFRYACCSSLYMDISVVAPPAAVYFWYTPLWHISYDNADSSFFTQPLTNEYVWSEAALRFGPSCFLLDFVRDEVLT